LRKLHLQIKREIMKRIITMLAGLFCMATAQAQLSDGHKAADFTVTSLNGAQTINLYSWLDSGYYVYLDVSATWCGPCWNFHNSHALKDLWTTYGPGTATNNVRVIYVEGDANTTDDDMNGLTTGSQGNWMTGATYPMCNPPSASATSINNNYEIGYFPTLYVICPGNKTVKELSPSATGGGWKTAAQLYAERPTTCPTLITVDAKNDNVKSATGGVNVSCDGNFGSKIITIKNLGANNLTACTITAKSGATVLGTQSWSGTLVPYASADVTVTINGAPATVGAVTYEVTATGDGDAANNTLTGKLNYYAPASANNLANPVMEDFQALSAVPSQYGFVTDVARSYFGIYPGTGTSTMVGADGLAAGKSMFVNFYNIPTTAAAGVMVVGNYANPAGSQPLHFLFDWAHAGYNGGEADQLEVVWSADCGSTWTSAWSKTGVDLNTAPNKTSSYIPAAAAEWKKGFADLSNANGDNVLVGFRAKSGYGNYGWIDNINIRRSALGINDLGQSFTLSAYPNPANDNITVKYTANEATTLVVTDVTGKVVVTKVVNSGDVNETINVSEFANGLYSVTVATKQGTAVRKVQVVH
jgi:Secretion system C-terminal sorting domain